MQKATIHKSICGAVAAACLGLGNTAIQASSFTFGPDIIDHGSVSATMDITLNAATNTLTAVIDNTSATSLEPGYTNSGGDNDHAPGIVGFGFNVDPDTLSLVSWTLTAEDKDGMDVVIGGSGSTDDWVMDTFLDSVSLDYLPISEGSIKGALYNPDAAYSLALAAAPNYFTTAELEMVFSAPPEEPLTGFTPFVRMRNIGVNGDGSSKQWGISTGGTDGSTDGSTTDSTIPGIPEPLTASLALVGVGVLGCTASRRR